MEPSGLATTPDLAGVQESGYIGAKRDLWTSAQGDTININDAVLTYWSTSNCYT